MPSTNVSFVIQEACKLYGADVFEMRRQGFSNQAIAAHLHITPRISQEIMNRLMSIIEGPRMSASFKIGGKGPIRPQPWHYRLAIHWMLGLTVEEIADRQKESILRIKNGLDQVRRCLGEPDPDRPILDHIHPIYTNGPSSSKPHCLGY